MYGIRGGWLGVTLACLALFGVACEASSPRRQDSGGVTEPAGDGDDLVSVQVDAGASDAGADDGAGEGTIFTPAAAPLTLGSCEACTADDQCGPRGMCVPLADGQPVCLVRCSLEFDECTRGFECARYEPGGFEYLCSPVGTLCCVDEDADGYGVGIGCRGPDCADDDITRHPDAVENCNNSDEDCDDDTDEDFADCGQQVCLRVGNGVFQSTGASGCEGGVCQDQVAQECGLFSCDGGGEDGDDCATSCRVEDADDDDLCAETAHCEEGGCELDVGDGEVCDEDSDCESGHCDNGFCCGAGQTCCAQDSDCPGYPGEGEVCDRPEACQGTRGQIRCDLETFACETESGVQNDSACDDTVLASACGLFLDLYCDGQEDQTVPACPSTCTDDTECDANAHCDAAYCFPDAPDGESCDEASDCASGYCSNGFCCASGDCCRSAIDCPGSYGAAATCDDLRACQGSRDATVCVNSQCGTEEDVADDSACASGLVADECGAYPAVRCSGSLAQISPTCATGCTSDSDCDEGGHCDDGLCVADLEQGQACDENSDCGSGYCGNGFCCAGGDCCASASDCPDSYADAPFCLAPSTCQGQRRDRVCDPVTNQCGKGDYTDDDSGCVGLLADDCGFFPGVECSAEQAQSAAPEAACDTSCSMDAECDQGAFCNVAEQRCEAEGNQGDPCVGSNGCKSGFSCVDGVCCSDSCTGECEACNVPGSLGSCAPVPSGEDPAGECGALDCGDYFAGFDGKVCYERAKAAASAVGCNGSRACEGVADVCPGQGEGDVSVICDLLCEDPRAGTCSGTTPALCDALDLGFDTCGQGICENTVPFCVSGNRNTCNPSSSEDETCNDLDDDCNGQVDDGLGGDGYEPNASCGEFSQLPTVKTDVAGSRTTILNGTIYPDGDADYYKIRVKEEGSSDCIPECGDNERSTLQLTLAVPAGAGSFEVCAVKNSCPSDFGSCLTVAEGTTDSFTVSGDSASCWWDSDNTEDFYIVVRGKASPGTDCQSYTLTLTGDERC